MGSLSVFGWAQTTLFQNVSTYHTLIPSGFLYASITGYLGYKPFRHEGKVTGLSARGNAANIDLPFPFDGPFPHRRITTRFPLYDWLTQLDGHSPEDIAAWLQDGLENELLWDLTLGHRSIWRLTARNGWWIGRQCSLNARISAEFDVPDLFIFPNMGDAGLAAGAAYLCGAEHFKWQPQKIDSVYWGPDITEFHIDESNLNNVECRQLSIEKLIAFAGQALAKGDIVARAVGKMEYGPRALGHRSIVCSRSKDIHTKLNRLLNRTETMPFAPIMRRETASNGWIFPECLDGNAMDDDYCSSQTGPNQTMSSGGSRRW